jgi:hypothetical protein
MMGSRQIEQGVLLYNSSLDRPAPADHLLRSIDRQGGVDDTDCRAHAESGNDAADKE